MEGMIGEIRLFAGNFAPLYWAFCNGQLQSIGDNSALFSIIGTTYGGDGITTFALPQLQGRVVLGPRTGPGLSTYDLGESGGSEEVTLLLTQLPTHTHIATAGGGMHTGTGKGNSGNPQGNYIDETSLVTDLFKATGGGANMLGGQGITVNNGFTGGNLPHNNMQPYTALNYIICLEGVYPSRN